MSTLLSLVVIFIILKKKLNIKLTFSISDIKRQIKYGLPLYFRDFFNQVNFRFIHLIIKNYYNSSVLGVFALASQAAEVLLYIPRAGFTVLFPHFSKEEINKGRLIKKSLKYFSVVFGLILLTSYFIVPFIIKRFFSSEFLGSILIFRILLVGIFSIGLLNIIESFLLGSYKQNIIMISSGISAITLIVASIILIPKFGLIGAAIITSIVFVMYLLITCFIYFHKCRDKKSIIKQANHFIHD